MSVQLLNSRRSPKTVSPVDAIQHARNLFSEIEKFFSFRRHLYWFNNKRSYSIALAVQAFMKLVRSMSGLEKLWSRCSVEHRVVNSLVHGVEGARDALSSIEAARAGSWIQQGHQYQGVVQYRYCTTPWSIHVFLHVPGRGRLPTKNCSSEIGTAHGAGTGTG